jgi:lipopolysaccharide heptosyltransferase II
MIHKENINRILLIKLRAIGDVVMSTVVIENLAKAFPNAHIDFITEPFCRDVVRDHPRLNQIITIDKKKMQNFSWIEKIKTQNRFFSHLKAQKYDLVFDFFGNPRSAILTLFSSARWRVGYDYRIRKWAYNVVVPSRAKELHEVDWHLDALHALEIPVVYRKPDFTLEPHALDFAGQFWTEEKLDGNLVIGLNFSGGWPAKRWPLERFAVLADRLVEAWNADILWIWGPGEKHQAEKCLKLMRSPSRLLPETNLKQLGALMQRMNMIISTDSGPMHIAAAVNTPTVGLFGPTQPEHQGPYGDKHIVVKYDSLACLGCNRLRCPHTSCMKWLTVDRVFAAAVECAQKNNIGI